MSVGSLTSSPSARASGSSAQPVHGVSGTVASPLDTMARLAVGSIILGTVTGRDSHGQLVLKTANGVVSVATTANPPVGSTVTLEVRATGDRLQVIILNPDQRPRGGEPRLPPSSTAGAVSGNTAASSAPPANTAPAPPVVASPAASVTAAMAAAVPATVIESATTRQIRRSLGGPAQVLSPGAAPGQAQVANPGPAGANAPQALAVGSELYVRLLPMDQAPGDKQRPATLPAPQGQLSASPSPGTAIPARVTALTPNGHPVLETPIGVFVLGRRTDVPVGSMLRLELVTLPAQAPIGAPSGDSRQTLISLATGWPALAEALSAVKTRDPAVVVEIAARYPRLGPRLAGGLLRAIQAMARGESEAWVSKSLREALTRGGHQGLLERIDTEASHQARHAIDGPGSDWRVMYLPLYDGATLHQINLFMRRRGQGGDRAGSDTRFVIEVDLSRLGAIQLDGLVGRKRFDLMLRTHAPLSEEARREIAGIHAEANKAAGVTGAIAFQTMASFPVVPLDDIAHHSAQVLA